MKILKFRTPIYLKGEFHHFSYWGIDVPKKGINSWRADSFTYTLKEDEQFIVVLDRNKKEIYEGDIIKNQNDIGVVEFIESEFLCMDKKENCWNLLIGEYEIIGNKHENPDLLIQD